MTSLAPPISIHFTRQQLAWLDRRRLRSSLSRSAALREAIDALIQQEEGSPALVGAMAQGSPLGGSRPLQLELTSQAELPAHTPFQDQAPFQAQAAAQPQAQTTTPASEG